MLCCLLRLYVTKFIHGNLGCYIFFFFNKKTGLKLVSQNFATRGQTLACQVQLVIPVDSVTAKWITQFSECLSICAVSGIILGAGDTELR